MDEDILSLEEALDDLVDEAFLDLWLLSLDRNLMIDALLWELL